jgi:hypothetical protein
MVNFDSVFTQVNVVAQKTVKSKPFDGLLLAGEACGVFMRHRVCAASLVVRCLLRELARGKIAPIRSAKRAGDFFFFGFLMICPYFHTSNMEVVPAPGFTEGDIFAGEQILLTDRAAYLVLNWNSICLLTFLSHFGGLSCWRRATPMTGRIESIFTNPINFILDQTHLPHDRVVTWYFEDFHERKYCMQSVFVFLRFTRSIHPRSDPYFEFLSFGIFDNKGGRTRFAY